MDKEIKRKNGKIKKYGIIGGVALLILVAAIFRHRQGGRIHL